jgi:hypothetical protein
MPRSMSDTRQGWIASPLAGVRLSSVGQIVALSGSERVYARHQWCWRLDMASYQCGVGVSGLWWVSDILRGMSLDGLVAQVGQILGDARSLYGARAAGRRRLLDDGRPCQRGTPIGLRPKVIRHSDVLIAIRGEGRRVVDYRLQGRPSPACSRLSANSRIIH